MAGTGVIAMTKYLFMFVSTFAALDHQAFGATEQDLQSPKEPSIELPADPEPYRSITESTPSPYPFLSHQKSNPFDLRVAILLSQINFTGTVAGGLSLNKYSSAGFGYFVDSETTDQWHRLIQGPFAMGLVQYENPTLITPKLQISPAYLFIKEQPSQLEERMLDTAALLVNLGVSIFLAESFSLLLQQSMIAFSEPPRSASGKDLATLTRSQVMFEFTF